MTPEKIVSEFAHSLDNFELIDEKLPDYNLTRLREAVAPLLLQILYNKIGAVHNLISLIRPEAAYVARYSKAFPDPTRVRDYDKNIDNDGTAVVCLRSKAAHKAKRADRTTYETARQETTKFMLDVVADTWVHQLGDYDSLYIEVSPKDIFSNLQAGCTSRHALNLLTLYNGMQRYHIKVKGIPEYINILKDAQRQAGRAGRRIADETLLLFASTVMLTSDRFPRSNYDWEERVEMYKTWAQSNRITRGPILLYGRVSDCIGEALYRCYKVIDLKRVRYTLDVPPERHYESYRVYQSKSINSVAFIVPLGRHG